LFYFLPCIFFLVFSCRSIPQCIFFLVFSSLYFLPCIFFLVFSSPVLSCLSILYIG
jgi:hypothetical protein